MTARLVIKHSGQNEIIEIPENVSKQLQIWQLPRLTEWKLGRLSTGLVEGDGRALVGSERFESPKPEVTYTEVRRQERRRPVPAPRSQPRPRRVVMPEAYRH